MTVQGANNAACVICCIVWLSSSQDRAWYSDKILEALNLELD